MTTELLRDIEAARAARVTLQNIERQLEELDKGQLVQLCMRHILGPAETVLSGDGAPDTKLLAAPVATVTRRAPARVSARAPLRANGHAATKAPKPDLLAGPPKSSEVILAVLADGSELTMPQIYERATRQNMWDKTENALQKMTQQPRLRMHLNVRREGYQSLYSVKPKSRSKAIRIATRIAAQVAAFGKASGAPTSAAGALSLPPKPTVMSAVLETLGNREMAVTDLCDEINRTGRSAVTLKTLQVVLSMPKNRERFVLRKDPQNAVRNLWSLKKGVPNEKR